MLAFFRRLLNNWVVGAVLALIALAIVVTGVGTPGGGGGMFGGRTIGGGAGEPLAKMDGGEVGLDEVLHRAQLLFQDTKQQQPGMTIASFIAQGGADAAVRGVITSRATQAWAAKIGMRVSDRQIDGEIASIPAFAGPDGKFDRATFLGRLHQNNITEAQLRNDVAADIIKRQLLSPVAGGARTPMPIVARFSAVLLETRIGNAGFVPLSALPPAPAPTDAEIKAFYARNIDRYSLPERRVVRYALIGTDQVAAAAKPSDAEIAGYYQAHAADYAAREDRSFSRLVFPGEEAAKAFVARVRGGTPFAAAAQAAGFSPTATNLGKQSRAALATLATPQVADAAFALKQGAITDPLKAPLGWFVVRADQVTAVPAKSLDQARPEVTALLTKQKGAAALANLANKVLGALDGGSTFDDVAKANGLTPVATPPLMASGVAPTDPAFRLAPEIQPLLKPAFEMEGDDAPSLETLGADRYALLKVGQVLPAAPRPLAEVHDAVVRDLGIERDLARARTIADAVAAKVNAGAPLAAALAGAGIRAPAVQPVAARQYDFARFTNQHQPVPAELVALFRLAPGKAKVVPASKGGAWAIVQFARSTPAAGPELAQLTLGARKDFDQALASELEEEFVDAIAKAVNVKENPAVVAKLKARLAGAPAAE